MKAVLCAAKNKPNDSKYNISQIELFAERTKAEKPDLLLFGESFLQGFDSLCFEYKKDILTTVTCNSKPIAEIKNIAKKYNIAIGFGFIENDHGSIFSSYLITGKNGETVDKYKRVSAGWRINDTCADYREGNNFHTFQFQNKKLAVIICGDLWEDYLLERIIALDTDALLWPVFCGYETEEWEASEKAQYAARTAIMDQPVLFVNSIVNTKNGLRGGGAFVWRHGNLMKEIPMGKDGMLIYEI